MPGRIRLRHVALNVRDLEACESFYREVLGMDVVWRPDADNVYLSSGDDNLALHRVSEPNAAAGQRLDHIGFMLESPESVDAWHAHLVDRGVAIASPPRTHRDGSRSLYCLDPGGATLQLLYEPRAVKPAGARDGRDRGVRIDAWER